MTLPQWRPLDEPWARDLTPHYGTETGGTPSSASVTQFLSYAAAFLVCPAPPLPFAASQKPCGATPVVDLISMSYDIDQLEIRMYEHSRFVDVFLIVESTVTHRGAPKPLFFPKFRHRFKALEDRIVFAVHHGTEHHVEGAPETIRPEDWRNEDLPRQFGFGALEKLQLPRPFVVLFGDTDEIWATPPPCTPPSSGLCPETLFKYKNTVSRSPEVVVGGRSGQTPVVFTYPAPKLPFHSCRDHVRGSVGYHIGSFLSPVAWLVKEISVAESWGIARRHGDPRARIANPYLIYDTALNRGAAPCCPVPRNQRPRKSTDRIPLALQRFGRDRYPYLMGSNASCNHYA